MAYCMLDEPMCLEEDCETCGWNSAIHEQRRDYIEEHGLTKCKDGLKRLIMKNKPVPLDDDGLDDEFNPDEVLNKGCEKYYVD